jgi:tetratricopeptide (TPR) repeat protein
MIGPHEETDAPAQTLRHGIALHRAGALAEASRLYEAVLERAPDDLDALRLLGILLAQSGDTEHGAMFIAAAATRMPDTATAETAFGDTLRRLDRQSDALAAFDRAIAADPQCAAAHAGRGLCLRGLGHLDAALEAHERALALDPANHAAGFGRGVVLQALGRIAEAADAYRETLRHAPRDEALWTNLSLALGALGRHADALDAADAALAQAPHMIEALAARAAALRALGDATRALAALDRAIAIDPGRATLHANRGNALRDLSRLADARDAYDRAVALDPGNADAHRLRAMCLLLAGDWVAGWPEWEWRKRATEASGARHADRPAWTGAEDPAGRRIFLHWEQGFGDTIQFCRYAPLLAARGAHVTLAVQGPLLRLASSLAAPRLDVIGGMREPTDGFDLHCPLMSLPLALATTPRSVPPPAPLAPPPDLRAAWGARLGPADGRPRIGLAWSGRPQPVARRGRARDPARPACALDLHAAGVASRGYRLVTCRRTDLGLRSRVHGLRRHRGADRQSRPRDHGRHQRRPSCRIDWRAGLDPSAARSGLALADGQGGQPLVSLGAPVPPERRGRLAGADRARRGRARGALRLIALARRRGSVQPTTSMRNTAAPGPASSTIA